MPNYTIIKKLLNKYDEPARLKTLEFIKGTTNNKDKYGVDILFNGGKYFNKIEVQALGNKKFIDSYKILTIFKRKDRYDKHTLYITYNYNYSSCYIFCRCQLTNTNNYNNVKFSVNENDELYYLLKKDVLIIRDINIDNFNIDILEKYFISKNTNHTI